MRSLRSNGRWLCIGLILCATTGAAAGPPAESQTSSAPATPSTRSASGEPAASSQPASGQPAPREPIYRSKAWAANVESEPPSYVRPLGERGWPGVESYRWLDLGVEHRTRWEYRDDDLRRPVLLDDNQFLLRSRAYLGVREIVDPFRVAVEFQDSRQFNTQFADSNRDINENDILQLFGELYFKDALGKDYPASFRAGRMTLEYLDRRLLRRNRWRNTTDAFDGMRLQLGQPSADWQFDVIAAMPVEIRLRQMDRSDEERWFYGLVGAWRPWRRWITLEPYYFILDEDRKDPAALDRTIHTMGLHVFGPLGTRGFDYSIDAAFQFGESGGQHQRAFAEYAEVGYAIDAPGKPRVAVSMAYASGDGDPDDNVSGRFDKLFGAGHPWSSTDYFTWQNMVSPKGRFEFRPIESMRLAASYGGYWLAADSDAWVVPGRRDSTGTSGSFIGHELELIARWELDALTDVEIGYSHFMPGHFVGNTGLTDDSDFLYVQVTRRL